MNLTKLFNFKYFKQNLKKSKGIVALLLIVVPIFTTLLTVLVLNSGRGIHTPSKEELITVNVMGMYIIPVLMSLVLFGYVYKKKSVDFINSQPINRKTVFITNTIGGILLMGIIQAVTAVSVLICGAILPELIIFPQMVLDIFIMMWISYSFTFVATNVAMSVSGTFSTQIVITMLILFLIPFCIDSYYDFSNGENYQLINGEKSNNVYMHTDSYYTMPYEMFHMIFSGTTEEFNLFSGKIISRMIVIGLVYYFIGLHLFKNRKMENNEESFSNEKIHIIVKALTILPMIILLNISDSGKEFNIIALAIIITYYFVYDFCVKRKIKLKVLLIYLVLTLVVLQGICSSAEKLKEAMPMRNFNIDNIASIKINSINEEKGNMHYVGAVTSMGGFIENEEIIKSLIESNYNDNNYQSTTENSEIIIAQDSLVDVECKPVVPEKNTDKVSYCNVSIKTKDGKIYCAYLHVFQKDLDKVLEILSKDEKYLSKIRNGITKEGILSINNYKILDNDKKEIIQSEIQNSINSMSLQDIRNLEISEKEAFVVRYYYKNHKLNGISISASVNQKVLEIVSSYMNKEVIAKLKEDVKPYQSSYKVWPKNIQNEFIYFSYLEEDILKFIKENENESFDVSKPYYAIEISFRGNRFNFYTNKVEELETLINKEIEFQQRDLIEDIKYEVTQ